MNNVTVKQITIPARSERTKEVKIRVKQERQKYVSPYTDTFTFHQKVENYVNGTRVTIKAYNHPDSVNFPTCKVLVSSSCVIGDNFSKIAHQRCDEKFAKRDWDLIIPTVLTNKEFVLVAESYSTKLNKISFEKTLDNALLLKDMNNLLNNAVSNNTFPTKKQKSYINSFSKQINYKSIEEKKNELNLRRLMRESDAKMATATNHLEENVKKPVFEVVK